MARPSPYQRAAAVRANPAERVVFTVEAGVIGRFDEWAVASGFASRAGALRSVVIHAMQPAKTDRGAGDAEVCAVLTSAEAQP